MSTINTNNRNYVFPLKDEDLESSNSLLRVTVEAIDSDVHNLFTNKADLANSISPASVDAKISTAISDYDSNLDIYGTYEDGDVNTHATIKTKLVLPAVNSSPGWASRVNINEKGLIIATDVLSKANISDFDEAQYMHLSGTETISGNKTFTGTVVLPSGTSVSPGAIFEDSSNVSTTKGWTANKIFSSLGNYVPLTSYTDELVLSKAKAASIASGMQTIASFGITDAYTKTEVDEKTWDWSDITTNVPTTISGYGITDAYTKTEVDDKIVPKSGTTALRPTTTEIGFIFFDTTLGKPIWWNDTSWVDATGIIV